MNRHRHGLMLVIALVFVMLLGALAVVIVRSAGQNLRQTRSMEIEAQLRSLVMDAETIAEGRLATAAVGATTIPVALPAEIEGVVVEATVEKQDASATIRSRATFQTTSWTCESRFDLIGSDWRRAETRLTRGQ
jgi:Tfp pilus assembly protein PilE